MELEVIIKGEERKIMQDSMEVGQISDAGIRHYARLAHEKKVRTDAPPEYDYQDQPKTPSGNLKFSEGDSDSDPNQV